MLEKYMYSQYLEAYDLCQNLINKAPDKDWEQKLLKMKFIIQGRLEDVPPLKPEEKAKKQYDEGLIYYWVKNLIYITGATQTLPLILDVYTDAKWYAGLSLVGLGGGIATSIISMRHSSMTWGRALAIDFATSWTALNTEAILQALFYPDQTQAYAYYSASDPGIPPLVKSVFPSAFDLSGYTRFNLAVVDVLSLTARFLAIPYTRDKTLSPGRYSTLISSMAWTTWFSSVLFSELESRPLFGVIPNPYNLLVSTLVGDTAVILLDHYYDRLNWTPRRVWLSDILGGVTGGIGAIVGAIEDWSNYNGSIGLVSAWWSVSGILLGMNLFDERESLGKTALLLNAYAWTTTMSAFLLGEGLKSTQTNTFPFYAFLSPALGNTAVSLLNHFYPQLHWSSTRSWLISLSGVLGIITGGLVSTIMDSPWVNQHPLVYSSLWGVAGLSLGTLLTGRMPEAVVSAPVEGINWNNLAFSLTPKLGREKVEGLDVSVYLSF